VTTRESQRRVLFLAYLFPPTGGGGVQRSLKFVKYLPDSGWTPTVLTVRPIAYYVYDPDLLKELPPEVEIVRTESVDPLRLTAALSPKRLRLGSHARTGRSTIAEGSRLVKLYRQVRRLLFFPDAQAGWMPFAITAGAKALRRNRVSVIYSPGAPYSSALVAYMLSAMSGIPYVVDFRDGWTDDMYNVPPTRLHRWAHRSLERLVVTKAAAVCVYGEWLAQRLAKRYPAISERIVTIPNGFDPADLQGIEPAPKRSTVRRIVYSGSLFAHHREVFATFLDALKQLPAQELARVELLIVGNVYEEAVHDVMRTGLKDRVHFCGYVGHAVALSYLLSADASLLLVRRGDVASVTGKVFELLMVGKPIIALAERDGECARILRDAGADKYLSDPQETPPVLAALQALLSGAMTDFDAARTRQFSRVDQTAALARVFEMVAP
jgi:glycosyltransferase involved in cell wall biosynthesis